MELPNIPARLTELLETNGLDTPEAVLAAGREGLEAISGIGPRSAVAILTAAASVVQVEEVPAVEEEAEEEATGDGGAPTEEAAEPVVEPEPAPRPAPAPPVVVEVEPPDYVFIQLAPGKKTAVIGGRMLLEGEARRLSWRQYVAATKEYPAGTFLVKVPGGSYEVAE